MAENTTGFQTSGFINKKGTPSGEGASFNQLPPGDDITNQELLDEAVMALKTIVPLGFSTTD